jgi:hypothetical protein
MTNIELREAKENGCVFPINCEFVKCETELTDSTLLLESNGECVFLYELIEGEKKLLDSTKTENGLVYLKCAYYDVIIPKYDCNCVAESQVDQKDC